MLKYQKARLARDKRYDGKFFIAVKTTKIYCRPICPAPIPKEKNVVYFETAFAAQEAGFRPCRRCRPESAPQSSAWIGNEAILKKAIKKIQAGALNNQTVPQFAESLGISERYLRKIFETHLGTSPQKYSNHIRLMFAKQLLHQTQLSMTEIAFSSGFNSVRRFNDAFKTSLKLTPTEIRNHKPIANATIQLRLNYAGSYNWQLMQEFLKQREITAIETVTEYSYERSYRIQNHDKNEVSGIFKATHNSDKNAFDVTIRISDISALMLVVSHIRRVLDIDTNLEQIEKHLQNDPKLSPLITKGLRLPACWDSFEAGIKAILGQQVSVKAAYTHTARVIEKLGENYNCDYKLFPSAHDIAKADLSFLKMPNSRKETLKSFAHWYLSREDDELDSMLTIKGIGPWTLEYIKLRSGLNSDAFPENDLGIIKMMEKHQLSNHQQWSPWRSYATLQLWNNL